MQGSSLLIKKLQKYEKLHLGFIKLPKAKTHAVDGYLALIMTDALK